MKPTSKILANAFLAVLLATPVAMTSASANATSFKLTITTGNFASGLGENVIRASGGQVNGRNVKLVYFAQGKFVANGGNSWTEMGNNGGRFNFKETHRDDWSVYLVDSSRNVTLQLDLHTKMIYYSDPNTPRRPQYAITNVSAPQATVPNSSGGINGRNVSKVWYPGGNFKHKGSGRWVEKNDNGKYNFQETHRDDWSVYLVDNSRGVNIQMDLHTKEIYYSDANTPRRVQYTVKKVK